MKTRGCHGYYSICPPDFDFWLSAAAAPVPEVAILRMWALPMCFSKLSETLLPVAVAVDCDSMFPLATEMEATGLQDDDITMPPPLLELEEEVPPCWTVCCAWLSFTFVFVFSSAPAASYFGTVGTDAEGLLITLESASVAGREGGAPILVQKYPLGGTGLLGTTPEAACPRVRKPCLLFMVMMELSPLKSPLSSSSMEHKLLLLLERVAVPLPEIQIDYVAVFFISWLLHARIRRRELPPKKFNGGFKLWLSEGVL